MLHINFHASGGGNSDKNFNGKKMFGKEIFILRKCEVN